MMSIVVLYLLTDSCSLQILNFSLLIVDLVTHEPIDSSVSLFSDMFIRVHICNCFCLMGFIQLPLSCYSLFHQPALFGISMQPLRYMIWISPTGGNACTNHSSLLSAYPSFVFPFAPCFVCQALAESFLGPVLIFSHLLHTLVKVSVSLIWC